MFKQQWGYELEKTNRPGIYRLKTGGFLIATQVTDETGKKHPLTRTFPALTSMIDAQRAYDSVRAEGLAKMSGALDSTQLFGEYAASLLERKIKAGEIKSKANEEKWLDALETHGKKPSKLTPLRIIPSLGSIPKGALRYAHIDRWRESLAHAIKAKQLSAATANTWLSILRVITSKMSAELEMRDPATGIENFRLAVTYTPDEPNSLTPEQAQAFLAKMRTLYPTHYALAVLGFATGLRPSSFRALRRVEDLDLDGGWLLIRRSHTRGKSVMDDTKTGKHQKIALPPALIDVLRAHLELLKNPPEKRPNMRWSPKMATSKLVFPSRLGGFQSRSALQKPFAKVAEAIGVTFTLTPRAMRRTYQDLARAAGVHDVVSRSISGHSTAKMQAHYSTANAPEQRDALATIGEILTQSPVKGPVKLRGRFRETG